MAAGTPAAGPINVDTIERLLAIVQRDVDATHPEVGVLAPVLQRSGSAVISVPNGWYSPHLRNEWPCTSPHRYATLAAMAHTLQDLTGGGAVVAMAGVPQS